MKQTDLIALQHFGTTPPLFQATAEPNGRAGWLAIAGAVARELAAWWRNRRRPPAEPLPAIARWLAAPASDATSSRLLEYADVEPHLTRALAIHPDWRLVELSMADGDLIDWRVYYQAPTLAELERIVSRAGPES